LPCFSKRDMDNPSSNSTWITMTCVSSKRYQNWVIFVLHASLNTTQRSKTVTNFRGPNVGNVSTKPQHPCHQSVDKKHCCLHVKLEVRLVIPFTRKSMSCKNRLFSWGMVHAFFLKSDG
jgi:hypothetical protein